MSDVKSNADLSSSAGATPLNDAIVPVSADRLKDLRRISHDLSNALEVIVQTSYLLSMKKPEGPEAEWMEMLEKGVEQALRINVELRTSIRNLV